MSRSVCPRCQRPERACICQFFTPVNNLTKVIILQHPSEVKQTKGSAALLVNSLRRCLLIEGEDFSGNVQLNQLLGDTEKQVILLYPSEHAQQISDYIENNNSAQTPAGSKTKETVLVLIDATWKKAYRMYMLSKNLHDLAHVTLPLTIEGKYAIRATNKKHALSTLEACVHALTALEPLNEEYQLLLENFVQFNQFQLLFRPE